MITLHELLEDKVFREYFTTPVKLKTHPMAPPPWRVLIQREAGGKWARKECRTYIEAFKFLKPYLKTCHDAAIQSKGTAFPQITRRVKITRNGQPVLIKGTDGKPYPKTKEVLWVPKLADGEPHHQWCPYCRRPTVFTWFSRHHAFGKAVFDPSLTRCTICGSSERLVRNA